MVKALVVYSPDHARRAVGLSARPSDRENRRSLFETVLNADVVDESLLREHSRLARVILGARIIPAPLVTAIAVFRRRHCYDIVVSWDDRFALIYSLLLLVVRGQARHVALSAWMASPIHTGSCPSTRCTCHP